MNNKHISHERLENIDAIRSIADREESLCPNSDYVEGDYLRLADSLIRLGMKIRIDHTPIEHLAHLMEVGT